MELPMTLSTFGLTRLSNSRTVWQPHYARRVLITDAVAIVLAMLFAQWVRFGGAGYGPSASVLYTGYSLLLAGLWLGVLALHHARSAPILGCGIEEYRRVVAASFWTFGVIAIVALLARLEIARVIDAPSTGEVEVERQRASALMLALGRERSAMIWEHLSVDEVKELSSSIAELGRIPSAVVEHVLVRFSSELSGISSLHGSYTDRKSVV